MAEFDYSQKILKKKDKPNEKGVKSLILLAPKSWFATIAGFNPAPALPGDTITIVGDHTFLATKGFITIETSLNSEALAELVGDMGGKGFAPKLTGFYPGNDKEAAEIMSHLKDDDVMALIPLADDQYLQMGREGLWAQVNPSWGSGTNDGGKNGWNIEIMSYNGTPIYYEGTVTKKPDAV
jgi:hypothetical protein